MEVQVGDRIEEIEEKARKKNAADLWDLLWSKAETRDWRHEAMVQVYTRIARQIKHGARVVDLGGGVGALAKRLRDGAGCQVAVWDHSLEAGAQCSKSGIDFNRVDLEDEQEWETQPELDGADCLVSTECIEHLSEQARHRIFEAAVKVGKAFISVPNHRLAPEEEEQHTVCYTALSFKRELEKYFPGKVRVEALGPFLLGVCGWERGFKLSMTMPVRDEERDIERTLASFRGAVDEIVIGIDPRSADKTREICERYADVVFTLEDPEGRGEEKVPDGGVHFSWCRNQCIERCTGDWIFMTEGHEHLLSGTDTLIRLDTLMPKAAKAAFVVRTGDHQQWSYPWIFRNLPEFRFKRATHNVLDYPAGTFFVKLPNVQTHHQRTMDRTMERHAQRKTQNRQTLLEDWVVNQNSTSLFYLGAEWREYDMPKAIARLEQLLALPPKNGAIRYQARLILGKEYWIRGDRVNARQTLVRATEDDWSRTEHFLWLGDMAWEQDNPDEALAFWKLAATGIGNPPFTLWWIDQFSYGHVPAQRLAMCYSAMERLEEAIFWAERVQELLPDDAPLAAIEECQRNVSYLRGELAKRQLEDTGETGDSDVDRLKLYAEVATGPDLSRHVGSAGPEKGLDLSL